MSGENNLWKWLSDLLPEGHYSRIESGDTAPGFPDVDYQIQHYHVSASGKMELKFARKPQAKYPFKKQGLRKSQEVWIRDHLRNGGTVWIIAQIENWVLILQGQHYKKFNHATTPQLTAMATAVLNRKDTRKASEILHQLLLDP